MGRKFLGNEECLTLVVRVPLGAPCVNRLDESHPPGTGKSGDSKIAGTRVARPSCLGNDDCAWPSRGLGENDLEEAVRERHERRTAKGLSSCYFLPNVAAARRWISSGDTSSL